MAHKHSTSSETHEMSEFSVPKRSLFKSKTEGGQFLYVLFLAQHLLAPLDSV